jgi:hypothetical protein
MASLPTATRDALKRDVRAIKEAMQFGISDSRRITAAAYIKIWHRFCQQLQLDAHLTTVKDPFFWLQIFAVRVRDGRLSASGHCV